MFVLVTLVVALIVCTLQLGIQVRMFSDLLPEEVRGSALTQFVMLSGVLTLLLGLAVVVRIWEVVP